jgi:four helix bundle protein
VLQESHHLLRVSAETFGIFGGSRIAEHSDMTIRSYRDLEAWQLSMELAVEVYGLTRQFPPEERYGLTSQVRRAAVGIPSNVSEGHRLSTKAYRHFVMLALGCHAECETQLELARRLTYVTEPQLSAATELSARVGQVLHGLLRSLPQ